MTSNDVIEVLMIIKVCYPYFYRNLGDEEADCLINIWSVLFADDDAKLVMEAVKSLTITLQYPPTIADIKEKMRLITQPDSTTEIEAWGIVRKAISNSSYESVKEFYKLPEDLQKLVGSPSQLKEWSMLDSTEITVIQSNFMRSYKAKTARDNEIKALPTSTKKMIAELSGGLKMIEGTND